MLANSVMYLFRKQKNLNFDFLGLQPQMYHILESQQFNLSLACQCRIRARRLWGGQGEGGEKGYGGNRRPWRQLRGREEGLSGRREADPAPAENAQAG